jgi:DNA-binding PadR family transcriptional regulator
MTLGGLSKNQAIILRMLWQQGPLNRAAIKAQVVPRIMAEGNVSATLNRMEAMGLVAAPPRIGKEWSLTEGGVALFEAAGEVQIHFHTDPIKTVSYACVDPEPATVKESLTPEPEDEPIPDPIPEFEDLEPEPEHEPDPIPEFEDLEPDPEHEPDPIPEFEDLEQAPPPLSHENLSALEVEMDLHKVRAKLSLPLIPARSARVYQQVVDCLPESLQEALRPISDMIAGLP